MMTESLRLHTSEDYFIGHFSAMASPCELLIETTDEHLARECLHIAHSEAGRIEHKFSRYRDDNIIHQINSSNGKPVTVDEETAALLDYADQCYNISNGLFDVTSGILRRIWRFDGKHSIPEQQQVDALLPHIGWNKVSWKTPVITLPEGMEIDLGGIGKEYAVDKTTALLRQHTDTSILVNYGGDIAVTRKRKNGSGWNIAVSNPDSTDESASLHHYTLYEGAMATSGDAHRCILHQGKRYGHILNPVTGWPDVNAPRSVTVLSNTCLEAGILSTLAILHGSKANTFLQQQQVPHWCAY